MPKAQALFTSIEYHCDLIWLQLAMTQQQLAERSCVIGVTDVDILADLTPKSSEALDCRASAAQAAVFLTDCAGMLA